MADAQCLHHEACSATCVWKTNCNVLQLGSLRLVAELESHGAQIAVDENDGSSWAVKIGHDSVAVQFLDIAGRSQGQFAAMKAA